MPKYRIKIEVAKETPEGKYDQWSNVYEQTVESLNVPALVSAINGAELPDHSRAKPV
jgi:hypothetical protein